MLIFFLMLVSCLYINSVSVTTVALRMLQSNVIKDAYNSLLT
jgi:hypothetical protein